MQLKFAGIESLILCTIACFQISFTKRPQCSSFAMKFFGSLREDRAKLLWDIEKESLVSVMHACFPRCEKDQRCVGVEVCTIRPDLLRCRGCCEWYVVDKDGGLPRNATDSCKYFELSKDSVESRGTRWSANLTAGTSSTYINNYGREFPASNVLDGVYGSYCLFANVYASRSEINPWLEVTWSGTITIWRIIIYNRVECCGSRLVNLKVTYQNKGITGICGFYPGLLSREGDIILFYCLPEAYATSVKLQIQSKAEQTNILNLCEVEIYKKT